jgi:hypothetical protein
VIEGEAVDQSRAVDMPLLPGELADTDVAEDAAHWAAVYEELTDFLRELDPPSDTLERYRRRLAHWRCRRDHLAGGSGSNAHPTDVR